MSAAGFQPPHARAADVHVLAPTVVARVEKREFLGDLQVALIVHPRLRHIAQRFLRASKPVVRHGHFALQAGVGGIGLGETFRGAPGTFVAL